MYQILLRTIEPVRYSSALRAKYITLHLIRKKALRQIYHSRETLALIEYLNWINDVQCL